MKPVTRTLRFLLLIILFGPWLPAAAQPEAGAWKGIEGMMDSREFQEAGLDKLSQEELFRLNQWLMRFIARDSQQVIKSDEKIREMQNAPVRRRIVGTFRGWYGDTTFELDNGEVWKQRLSGRYSVELDNPEVEISRNLLGFYELKVVKTGARIGVTRVK